MMIKYKKKKSKWEKSTHYNDFITAYLIYIQIEV